MKTFFGVAPLVAFLFAVAPIAAGCSGTVVGTGSPDGGAAAASGDQPNESDIVSADDGGAPSSDASHATDGGATKDATTAAAATATVIVDGTAAQVGEIYAINQGSIASNIRFTTPIFHGELMMDIRLVGSGCSSESGNSLIMVNNSSTSNNVFLPEQPESVCGLVITSTGKRVVGSFQGTVAASGDKSSKHTLGVSFDIPVN